MSQEERLQQAKRVENNVRSFEAYYRRCDSTVCNAEINPISWHELNGKGDVLSHNLSLAMEDIFNQLFRDAEWAKHKAVKEWVIHVARDEPSSSHGWHAKMTPNKTQLSQHLVDYMFEGNRNVASLGCVQMLVDICFSGLALVYGWLPTDTIYIKVYRPWEGNKSGDSSRQAVSSDLADDGRPPEEGRAPGSA